MMRFVPMLLAVITACAVPENARQVARSLDTEDVALIPLEGGPLCCDLTDATGAPYTTCTDSGLVVDPIDPILAEPAPVSADPTAEAAPAASDPTLVSTVADPLPNDTKPKPVPAPLPAPTPQCAPSGDGGVPPKKNCCVCQYWDVPACNGKTTDADCTAASPDCLWTDGTCKPRHLKDCENWAAQQAQKDFCDAVAIVPLGGDPTGGLKGCTRFRYQYEGHGQTCQDLANRVLVCINREPACSDFQFDDDGCMTFANIADARGEMERIVRALGGSQCVSVSADQCSASTICQSRYIFTITTNGICNKPGPCNAGGFCYTQGETALCSTDNGITSKICCCTDPANNTGCTWKVGTRSCN
jgi:hypothetical protein